MSFIIPSKCIKIHYKNHPQIKLRVILFTAYLGNYFLGTPNCIEAISMNLTPAGRLNIELSTDHGEHE